MSNETSRKNKHPLFVSGDEFAGAMFVRILVDVLSPVSGQPNQKWLNGRGFDLKTRKAIVRGEQPVAVEAVAQLVSDHSVAYAKEIARGWSKDHVLLKSLVAGDWDQHPELLPATTNKTKKSKGPSNKTVQHPFFVSGDEDFGRWFVETIGCNRTIRRRVIKDHQIDAMRLEKIEAGELFLPREVFKDVMQCFNEHFAKYPKDVKPRPYRKLRNFAVQQKLIKEE